MNSTHHPGAFPISKPDTKQLSFDASDKPHAYDPVKQREYFQGVLRRRIIAFLFDLAIVCTLTLLVYALLLVLGIFTLGLAWLLFGIAFPAVALGYSAYTLSSPASATIGMRFVELQMRTWYGAPMYALLGAFHTVLFYVLAAVLTPFILLIAPFNASKRCLHDFLAGTVVINNDARAKSYRSS